MTMENEWPQENIAPEAESPASEVAEEAAAQQAEQPVESDTEPQAEVESELEKAQKDAETYLNLAQRVQADFENYRRRNQNSIRDSYEDGAFAFAGTLLPVLDNLERAIQAAAESPDESLKSGVEMVYRQLCDVFAKRGIHPIECLGKPFDPNLENAVMQGAPEEGEPGTVCAVFQKGYQMDGKLLRAAMVKVVPEA